MHVVLNKCFVLTLKENTAKIRLVVIEKNATTTHFNSEKWRHRAAGKAILITGSVNRLKVSFRLSETKNGFRKPEIDF